MKKELNNFIVESEHELDYFDQIIDYILVNEKEIFNFFDLTNLSSKWNIKIMSYNLFKEHIINKYGQIHSYIRGDTDSETKTIIILNVEDQIKYTSHVNSTLKETLKMIMHEIVHACNDEINDDYNQIIWFSEGLATNLSSQDYNIVDLSDCDFELLKNDWYNFGKRKYQFAYTIVNFILKTYSKEEISKLFIDSSYLRIRSDKIFEDAKKYSSSHFNQNFNPNTYK